MSKDPRNTNQSSADGDASQSTPLKKKAGRKGNFGSSRKMTAKEQSERFIKTARKLDVDETGTAFDAVADRVILASGDKQNT